MIRNPTTHFESVFNGYQIDTLLGMNNSTDPFDEFLSKPGQYLLHYLKKEPRFDINLNMAKNGKKMVVQASAAWIFLGFISTAALVMLITAMITYIFIKHTCWQLRTETDLKIENAQRNLMFLSQIRIGCALEELSLFIVAKFGEPPKYAEKKTNFPR